MSVSVIDLHDNCFGRRRESGGFEGFQPPSFILPRKWAVGRWFISMVRSPCKSKPPVLASARSGLGTDIIKPLKMHLALSSNNAALLRSSFRFLRDGLEGNLGRTRVLSLR